MTAHVAKDKTTNGRWYFNITVHFLIWY